MSLKSRKKKNKFKKKPSILSRLIVALFSIAILAMISALVVLAIYSRDLPDYEQLASYNPPLVTRLYAGDGRLLEEYANQRRLFVPYNAMPEKLINAFISAEDRRYFEHNGIDPQGIIRAAMVNLKNMGENRALAGGSTITQQVVKNMLLTNQQTLGRKIREALIAIRMNSFFPKEKVLELYLNEIYLGGGSYGVAAAAQNYFNKSVDELELEEVALLAALPKAPARYNPFRNYDRALERRNWVLERMVIDNHITEEELEIAKNQPIKLQRRANTEIVNAPSFAEEVRRELESRFGAEDLYNGGYVVRTTLDPDLQKYAIKSLRNGAIAYDKRQGFDGPIANISIFSDDENGIRESWSDSLQEFDNPEGTDSWQLAVVIAMDDEQAEIGLKDGSRAYIEQKGFSWAGCYHEKQAYKIKKQEIDSKLERLIAQIRNTPGYSEGYIDEITAKVNEDDEAKKRELAKCKAKSPDDIFKIGDVILVQKQSDNDDEEDYYALKQVPGVNGAVIVLDAHTGRVLAMAGGHDFSSGHFNRATQARRQPGSAFKPFVYLTALAKGLTPATTLVDAPVAIPKGGGVELWTPRNYSGEYHGVSTLRMGLEKSRNVLTVRLAQMIGVNSIINVARKFDLYDELPSNYAPILGAVETTPLRMTAGYAMIVNGGKKIIPTLIEKIQDRNGKTVFERDQRNCIGCEFDSEDDIFSFKPPEIIDNREEIMDPYTSYQMVSMLEGVVKRGTGWRAKKIGKPIAGKTGTTNGSIDAWFIGFSPDYVVGVYMGYDKPRSLGEKETGSSVAVPIFVDVMEYVLKDKPATPFRIPDGIRLIKVNRQNGKLPDVTTASRDIIFEAFKPGDELPVAADQEEDYDYMMIEEMNFGRGRGSNIEAVDGMAMDRDDNVKPREDNRRRGTPPSAQQFPPSRMDSAPDNYDGFGGIY